MRAEKGFTLIELLIVVAIIGIIAAVAIPNLLNAVDRGKQKRTMADMRTLATGIEAYSVDNSIYPTTNDINVLEPIIRPTYSKGFPFADGWDHPFAYLPSAPVGVGYTIRSPGKDGVVEGAPTGGPTADFDCDIIYSQGVFAQWPEGSQQ